MTINILIHAIFLLILLRFFSCIEELKGRAVLYLINMILIIGIEFNIVKFLMNDVVK